MKSNFLFWLLTTVLLTTSPVVDAQQSGKIFRIGFLDNGTASDSVVLAKAFLQELSKLGWVEGKNESPRPKGRGFCQNNRSCS